MDIDISVCFHFSNFTAQSSSLTSLASTLSEGLNEATKRSPNHNRSENLKSLSLKTSNHESSAQFFLIFPLYELIFYVQITVTTQNLAPAS